MDQKVEWVRRPPVPVQVRGRGGGGEALHPRADGQRDHVCLQPLVVADARVASRRQHVHEALVRHHLDALAADGIAYVPFFPLGGFGTLRSDALSQVAERLGAAPMQAALAWLLRRSPNILLIPGTSSVPRLDEKLAAATLRLPDDAMAALDGIGH